MLAPAPYPALAGYRFPAEFERHDATWLSWPHNRDSWPGKIEAMYPMYAAFVARLAESEHVHINVNDAAMQRFAEQTLAAAGCDLARVTFHHFPTNDAWCRDHGPAFLVNPVAPAPKAIVDWGYNAWGGKYPPFDLDDVIPTRIAELRGLPLWTPGIVMEGGSVEFNGAGALLTSTSCLLNPNRNPHLSKREIEEYLIRYYCVDQILWVDEGIVGDDTDGHIDDTIRFVDAHTVVAAVEPDTADDNHAPLARNLAALRAMRLADGRALDIIELPMPDPVWYEGQRLPASYANFYIANDAVFVPTYRCDADVRAIDILAQCFPTREVVGIDSTDIVWGLGSFHCLSQQEPSVESGA